MNLKDDPSTSIDGVLWTTRGHWFVLRRATYHNPPAPPEPIPGEVFIHRSNIAFIQVE